MLLIHCELFFFVSPDVVYGCVPLTFTYIKLMMCIDLLCSPCLGITVGAFYSHRGPTGHQNVSIGPNSKYVSQM